MSFTLVADFVFSDIFETSDIFFLAIMKPAMYISEAERMRLSYIVASVQFLFSLSAAGIFLTKPVNGHV